ncbi:MAG: CsgG/HfaB family protein [Candidatus Omnitrophica bacterium]|nr:CsgG/HfaB family protein [Candidatus Omnitrophota bacterium]
MRKTIVCAGFLFFVICFSTMAQAAALKKTVAVSEFENKTNASGSWHVGTGMADMLTDALIQSGQFIVLERQALDAVMAEQNLAASDRASKAGTGAQSGNIKKAQILIQGAVTEFDETKSSGGQGLKLYGVSVRNDSATAHVAVIIRLIDTSTSQVLASQRVEGDASEGGVAFSASAGVVDFGQSAFKKTPLGKATQMAIDRAVQYIATQMGAVAWKGKVIKLSEDGMILVNAGTQSGMMKGQVLRVLRPSESIIDPDTGMELGQESKVLGTATVEEAFDKYSKAQSVYLSQPAQSGDIVEALQ